LETRIAEFRQAKPEVYQLCFATATRGFINPEADFKTVMDKCLNTMTMRFPEEAYILQDIVYIATMDAYQKHNLTCDTLIKT
jgi:hypothetical protein